MPQLAAGGGIMAPPISPCPSLRTVPARQERRLRVELAETALGEITEIRAQDRIEFAARKFVHRGSLFLAAQPRPDALDDLLVGLGEPVGIGGARRGMALDV